MQPTQLDVPPFPFVLSSILSTPYPYFSQQIRRRSASPTFSNPPVSLDCLESRSMHRQILLAISLIIHLMPLWAHPVDADMHRIAPISTAIEIKFMKSTSGTITKADVDAEIDALRTARHNHGGAEAIHKPIVGVVYKAKQFSKVDENKPDMPSIAWSVTHRISGSEIFLRSIEVIQSRGQQ
ncbi:hypothetical protein H0H93_010635 [Arthromyces matolae]|nr:hypothetical protein H0H93_010635 [Arthromyces matolae]